MRETDDKFSDYDKSSSTILTTRFGYESTKLIHLAQKNLYIIIGLIAALVVLSLLNILGALDYFSTSSEQVDKIVDLTLLLVLIAVLIPLVLLLLKSRNMLDRWTDMFERNTIMTTMSITMTTKSREEAIIGLSQSILEISKPLYEYMTSRKDNLDEFLNVSIPNTKDLVFDVLLDSDRVLDDDGSSIGDNLKRVLKEYGSIIIKIVDGNIDRNLVESFVDSLLKYNSVTKHSIGMGLVIGESVTDDTKEYMNKISFHRKKGIDRLITIVKPSPSSASPSSQQASVI
ncbi:MAG TPA: hypothetical protein VFD60_14100 [Nitrososphaeraceae archaeon]|jgi:hypothetical protein|nr:hypothetical protein [Nitrososphaeraceae archaeon]